jgi:hypothetical protein
MTDEPEKISRREFFREVAKAVVGGTATALLASACRALDRVPPSTETPLSSRATPTPSKSTKEASPVSTRLSPKVESGSTTPPEPLKEASRWIREWPPDETIPLQEWWNDMVSQRHIRIDGIARYYAGKEIDALVDGAVLVPNPQNYQNPKNPLIGNCTTTLSQLVSRAQGHITVSPEAYRQLPGANNCQVFGKTK